MDAACLVILGHNNMGNSGQFNTTVLRLIICLACVFTISHRLSLVIGKIIKDGESQKFEEKLQFPVHVQPLGSILDAANIRVRLLKMVSLRAFSRLIHSRYSHDRQSTTLHRMHKDSSVTS